MAMSPSYGQIHPDSLTAIRQGGIQIGSIFEQIPGQLRVQINNLDSLLAGSRCLNQEITSQYFENREAAELVNILLTS